MQKKPELPTGKTIVITGANSGIGKEIARQICNGGHRLVFASRNTDRSRSVRDELLHSSEESVLEGGEAANRRATEITVHSLDLGDLTSIRGFADALAAEVTGIDVLINNAGVFSMKNERSQSGFELMLGVNYVGPFYLTHLLLPLLRANATSAGTSRIINVSSDAYRYGKIDIERMEKAGARSFRGYARSKVALNLFTMHFARLTSQNGPTVNAIHPGHVATSIWDLWPNMPWLGKLLRAIAQRTGEPASRGASLACHLALSPELSRVTGRYFTRTDPESFQEPCNEDLAAKLYDWTLNQLGLESAMR